MTKLLKRASILALALVAVIVLPTCSTPGALESPMTPSQPDSTAASSVQPSSEEPSIKASTEEPAAQGKPLLAITANGTSFNASFEGNSSAEAFADLLQEDPLTLSLHDYGDFEKVGPLGTTLPTNDEQITTQPGDVILYQGDQITIYYDANAWNFTRIAHIDGASRENLLEAFGQGDVEVTFELQWDDD